MVENTLSQLKQFWQSNECKTTIKLCLQNISLTLVKFIVLHPQNCYRNENQLKWKIVYTLYMDKIFKKNTFCYGYFC